MSSGTPEDLRHLEGTELGTTLQGAVRVLDPELQGRTYDEILGFRDRIEIKPEWKVLDPKRDYFRTGSRPGFPKIPRELKLGDETFTVFYDESPATLKEFGMNPHLEVQILKVEDGKGNRAQLISCYVMEPVGLPDQGRIVPGTEMVSVLVQATGEQPLLGLDALRALPRIFPTLYRLN